MHTEPLRPNRIRRILALVAVVVALPLALAACGSSASSTDAGASAKDTSWSFTDDLGVTVRLDHTPTRVAGYSDLLGALMDYGLKPVASWGWSSLAASGRFEGLDTSGLTEVGKSYGGINLEKLAALKPDLIVVNAYPKDASGKVDTNEPLYGFKDLAQQQKVAAIAPIVAITMGGNGKDVVERSTALATSLGAKQSVVDEQRKTFSEAATRLTAAARSGVSVTALYADADGVWVNRPKDDPALRMYTSFGVDMPDPGGSVYYWKTLSWENAGDVTGDILLYSNLGYGPAELKKRSTFARLPAVKAGRLYPNVFASTSWGSQAKFMDQLAGYIEKAAKDKGTATPSSTATS